MQDRVEKPKSCNYEEMLKIRKEIVDFHGEMVLLENYSALNYTGKQINLLISLYIVLYFIIRTLKIKKMYVICLFMFATFAYELG